MKKAIVIGPAELHNFFTSVYDNWDTQVPVERVNDVWTGLSTGVLSPESEIVVFTDADFEDPNERNEAAKAVGIFASEALVLVVFYENDNYEPFYYEVKNAQQEGGFSDADFIPISAQGNVIEEIKNAIETQATARAIENGVSNSVQEEENVESVDYVPATLKENNGRKRGLVVASTSSKGGSGKTTVGMLTASMFYHASKAAVDQGLRDKPLNVCIVDMDIRDGQIGFIIGQLAPTALNIYLETEKDKDAIARNLIKDERLGIHALLAPKRAKTAEFLSPEFYMLVIDHLAEMFDVVVLDTSVDYTDVLLSKVVFPIADAIMFVTNLSVGSVYGMNRWMDEVTLPAEEGGAGISKTKIGVVVNQSAPNMGIDEELLRRAANGAELLVAIPLDTTGVVAASNHNRLSDILLHHRDISPAYYNIINQLLPNEVFADPLLNENGTTANSAASTKGGGEGSNTNDKKNKRGRGRLGGLFG